MTKRLIVLTVAVVLVLGVASIAMASGGEAPPVDTGLAPTGKPTITGTVVMDPHMDGATPTAKYAVITLRDKSKKIPAVSRAIKLRTEFPLHCGCNLGLSGRRFVYGNGNAALMRDWIPEGDLNALFLALGQAISPTAPVRDPIITAIAAQDCVDEGTGAPDPVDSVCTADPGFPVNLKGWLLMEFVVDFLTPGGN